MRLYVRDISPARPVGTPILCLSGLVRNSDDFHKLSQFLVGNPLIPEGRRIVCLDYRGRGRSDRAPDWRSYTPQTYLSDIRHVLAALDLGRVVVFGVSLGGILAMAMGTSMASAIAGAVLIDIGPEVDKQGLARISGYVGLDQPVSNWPEAVARLKATWQNNRRWTEEDWMDVARGTFREEEDGLLHVNWDVAIAKNLAGGSNSVDDLWPLYRSLAHVPVMIVRGARSDILSAATFARMQQEIPDAMGLVLEDVGHVPLPHDPDILAALPGWLDRCDRRDDR